MARVRLARREGVRVQKPVVEPPQGQCRLEPGGCGPVSSARTLRGRSRRLGSRRTDPARRPWGRTAAYPWRGCRGKAGHLTRRPVRGERGNRPGAALPADQPGRRRARSSSARSSGAGRSPRSSPRPGKPATWPRGAAIPQWRHWNGRRSPVNTGAPRPTASEAEARVLRIQTKLHRWATDEPTRRFDDLYNLVCDPAFLLVAWRRVRGNKGARTAGVDGQTARSIEAGRGVEAFLDDLRAELKARTFTPLPVRERTIPKPGRAKVRRLGTPTVRDRVVQAALKLVLEPIFEASFQPCSYGFRPKRRAQDAIAEVHFFASRTYEWTVEGDIEACFDELSHVGIMDRLRLRVGDKRVLVLVKAFLKAGILTEDGADKHPITGTPQGGILSPLLANVALSVLDDRFAEAWRDAMS